MGLWSTVTKIYRENKIMLSQQKTKTEYNFFLKMDFDK